MTTAITLAVIVSIQVLMLIQQVRNHRETWARMHTLHEHLDRMYKEAGKDEGVKLFETFLRSEREEKS